jgi:hypothetical protein
MWVAAFASWGLVVVTINANTPRSMAAAVGVFACLLLLLLL